MTHTAEEQHEIRHKHYVAEIERLHIAETQLEAEVERLRTRETELEAALAGMLRHFGNPRRDEWMNQMAFEQACRADARARAARAKVDKT